MSSIVSTQGEPSDEENNNTSNDGGIFSEENDIDDEIEIAEEVELVFLRHRPSIETGGKANLNLGKLS